MKITQSALGDLWLKFAAWVGRSKHAYTGSTIDSKWIVLRSDLKDLVGPLAHELVHVDQINRMGWFSMRYEFLLQDLKLGHQNAPMEIEAFGRAPQFMAAAREILAARELEKKGS